MYPNLYYAFKDLFGVEIPGLKVLQTFGFFVAVAFLAAAYVLTSELRRREKLGLLHPVPEKVIVGKPASLGEIITSAVIGFIIGYKLLGLFGDIGDFRDYLLSLQGSFIGGVLVAAVMGYYKYYTRKKKALPKPKEETQLVYPHQRVPDFTIMAAVAGLIGAKIFHNLENWGDFVNDPWGSIFSASGLTFYGGLIVAAYVIIRYANKKSISWKHLVDSAGPALMLAYAIGRMGCQFAGDGDWGINNSAYGTDPATGKVVKIAPAQYQEIVQKNADYFIKQFGSLEAVPHRSFEKPAALSWLPDYFIAYSYPHNVVNDGIRLDGCTGEYCNALPVGVFPTPLYEIIVCGLFFIVLMAIRKKVTTPGVIFGIYLILNGVERFFVEKIRVNTKYEDLIFQPTQAELISCLLVIGGAALIWYARKTNTPKTA